MKNGSQLRKLLVSKDFKNHWNSKLDGEKNKILPPEFKEAVKTEPLIANKGWHYWSTKPAEEILRDNLVEKTLESFKAAKPINDFLSNPL